jgi:16S rRNA (guanine(527)-N(7))-methyltransferase RsmG
MVQKHYIDSILVAQILDWKLPSPLLDVGTGAGLPAIPLKIACPDTEFILSEGRHKRVQFLHEVVDALGLEKIEIYGHKTYASFSRPIRGVITRAVEPIVETLARVKRSLQAGGWAIFMKGPQCDAEIEEAARSMSRSYRLERDIAYSIPHTPHQRRLIIFERLEDRREERREAEPGCKASYIESMANETFKRMKALLTSKGIKKEGHALVFGQKIIREIMRDFPDLCAGLILSPLKEEIATDLTNPADLTDLANSANSAALTDLVSLKDRADSKDLADHFTDLVDKGSLPEDLREIHREVHQEILPEDLRETHREVHREILPEDLRETHREVQREIHQEIHREDLPDKLKEIPIYRLSSPLYRELDIFGTGTAILLVRTPPIEIWRAEEMASTAPGCTLMLPFQDPENTGAVIRSAAAFGVRDVILLQESANPYHPKSIRAGGSAIFRVNYRKGPSIQEIQPLARAVHLQGIPLITLSMEGTRISQFQFPESFILLPGLEGPGLPEDLRHRALAIPMEPGLESLNAATAAAIALYEWRRRMG